MKTLAILIVMLLLAGCGEYVYEPDLYAMEAGGQATAVAAQALRRATQEASFREVERATMMAAETQGAAQIELDLLAGRLEATRGAQALEMEAAGATADARQVERQETQAAYLVQATQAVMELRMTADVLGAQATQTAIVRLGELEAIEQDRREALATIQPVVWLVAALVVALLVVQTYTRLLDWNLEWRDRKNRLYETRLGTVIFELGENGEYYARLLSARSLPAKVGGEPTGVNVVKITASGSVLSSPVVRGSSQRNGTPELAIELLREAVRKLGESSTIIPGWRDLSWSSDRWQRVIAALSAAGLVVTKPGVGTYINDQRAADAGDLLYQLETRQVRLRPTPPGNGSDLW